MNPIYHPDSLSLVVPSYSRRGVFASQCVKYLDALSQKGSTIETAVEIVRGVVPEPHSSRVQSETFRLGNHPSRHRKERDDAALLTQEGNSLEFTVTKIPAVKSNRSIFISSIFQRFLHSLRKSLQIRGPPRSIHVEIFQACQRGKRSKW